MPEDSYYYCYKHGLDARSPEDHWIHEDVCRHFGGKEMTYELTVEPVVENVNRSVRGTSIYDNTNYWYWDNTYIPSTFTYTYPHTIYKYQVTCPVCKTLNWAELDTVVECTGILSQERRPGGKKTYCKATLKAVSKKVDHEVEVSG